MHLKGADKEALNTLRVIGQLCILKWFDLL